MSLIKPGSIRERVLLGQGIKREELFALINMVERYEHALQEIAGGPNMQRRTSLQAIARDALSPPTRSEEL